MHIYTTVRATALPNYLGAKIPIPSGLNIPAWRKLLTGYHDRHMVDFLEYGWPVDYTADTPPNPTNGNHQEDPTNTVFIESYVETEMRHGALLGPFTNPPFTPWSQTSPMMTRPKKDSAERRVIVDLSWPRQHSVNSGIRRGFYQGRPRAYTLPNVMDAADEVARLGPACYLWSADLARAYRQLRSCPLSTPLLGITLHGKHYTDITPPFGCRTSSMACARTTNAVVYLLRKKGHHVHCYLDDFVGVAPTLKDVEAAYQDFNDLASQLGLELSPAKCVPPTKSLEWLGFSISAQHMTVTIPTAKLDEIITECESWTTKYKASRKELQRLVGRLQHIAKCVQPARRFMSRILKALRDTPYTGKHNTTPDLKSDIRWFLEYAARSNGMVLLKPLEKPTWTIECDSSLKAGGAFSQVQYYSQPYPEQLTQQYKNIAHLEAINLLVGLKVLTSNNREDYKVVINTDNSASQQVLSSGAGRDPVLTACAREIWLYAATHSCQVEILHKPGKDLVLADALSRRATDPAMDIKATRMTQSLNLTQTHVKFDDLFTKDL